MRVVIDLPMPPSNNAIWRSRSTGRGASVYRADEYRVWLKECQQLCMAHRWHKTPILGRYEITIALDREKCRKGSDLGNREKAVSDFLQSAGIIINDNLAERIEIKWGEAPLGCRVTLDDLQDGEVP